MTMASGPFLLIMILAEGLLILAVAVFLLLRRISRLKQELAAQAGADEASEQEVMNLRQGIEHLIHETREFLALDDAGKVRNQDLTESQADLLLKRMAYLRAEQNCLTGNDQVQTMWTQLYGELGPLFAIAEPEPADEAAANKKLLEKSRRLFEGMQETMSGYMRAVEELLGNLPGLADGSITLTDLQRKVGRLEDMRGTLFGRLGELEDFTTTDLASAADTILPGEVEGSVSEIHKLHNMLQQQHGTMDRLKAVMSDEAMPAEMMREIEKQLGEIDEANKELRVCMDMLKMEQIRKIEEKLSGAAPAKESLFDTLDEDSIHQGKNHDG